MPRFEAFRGFILILSTLISLLTWVARLHLPFFHFMEGSGQDVQYQPVVNWTLRLQPLHASTTGWQVPPLNEQPFLVINTQSTPGFTVVQFMGITSKHK
jgi:hypothetical protein